MKRPFTLLVLVLLVSTVQADSLTTIPLQNRPAAEVIPIIEPMLAEDDAISGQGFSIFLRSSPETLAQVRSMIDVLDVPAKVLQVSVFQGSERDLGELGISASVEIERGDASVDIGTGRDSNNDAGGSVTYSTSDGHVSVDGISTQGSLRDTPIHQVRVTEGTEAYIETGERIPYFYGAAWNRRGGFAGSIEYKDAVTGFYVLPRVRGDNVVLEVNPFKSMRSDSGRENVDTQSAGTTVTGRIGEWILVGGVAEYVEQSRSTTGTTVATQGRQNSGIWIKADIVQ